MISTHSFGTLRYYNPRFWHILRPFGVLTHVESVVCLTRRIDNELRERMN